VSRRAALVLAATCTLTPTASASQTATNELARIHGDVGYAIGAQNQQTLLGSIVLPRDAFAITQPKAAARIVFSDSSEIRIGDRTRLRIGDVAPGSNERTILLERGAVRFDIIHPAGPHTTYTFKTPTSQIAVRGTIGYAVTGPSGDQIYCIACQPDDVEVRAGDRSLTIVSGQSINVLTQNGHVTGAAVVQNETINNPAVDQFLGGLSPFGKRAADGFDVTGSQSGS
jgi:ferric-dicitrate binding protein FerR (iron transport regulator)